MRTVSYKSVLDGLLKMRGEDPDNATLGVKLAMGEFLNQGLSACHEFWRWPDLVTIEQRFLREFYLVGESYTAGSEVYFPASEAYYRALRTPGLSDYPATLVDGEWVTNAAYWADFSEEIAGDDWATGTAYVRGSRVRDPFFGLFYQCHTAHTSSGSFLDGTKFGRLAEWRPYIAYEQNEGTAIEAVIEVYDRDPRSDKEALKVPFRIDSEGVRFAADQEGPVWIEFRKRCPDYGWSVLWSAASFAAGAVVFYATDGEVYETASAASSGDVPGTAAKWVKAEVPYIFRNAAKLKAYALWLESNGKTEAAMAFDNNDPARPGKFQNEIEEQVWQYTKLQGQTGRVTRREER